MHLPAGFFNQIFTRIETTYIHSLTHVRSTLFAQLNVTEQEHNSSSYCSSVGIIHLLLSPSSTTREVVSLEIQRLSSRYKCNTRARNSDNAHRTQGRIAAEAAAINVDGDGSADGIV